MKRFFVRAGLILIGVTGLVAAFIFEWKPSLALKPLQIFYRERAGLHEKSLKVGQDTIHYFEAGVGAPVIFIHGFGDNKDSFVQLVRGWKEHHRVILIEVPGFGDSEFNPDQNYSIHTQVERIRAFCNALGIKKADFVGNSMGGHISAALAIHDPDRISRLVLLSPAGLKVDDPIPYRESEHPIRNDEEFDAYVKTLFFKTPWIPLPFRKTFIENSIRSFHALNRIKKDIREGEDYVLNGQLSQIKSPTFVIWGKADGVVHVVHAEVWRAGIPGSELKVVENAGHSPQYEMPEECSKWIEGFLTRSTP